MQNAVPPLVQAGEVVPGRSLNYASTCGGCNAGCGLLVKSRDGRPIKLEGNPNHPFSGGGVCAVGQASILGLYDNLRLQHPLKHGEETSWTVVDREIRSQLDGLRRQGKKIRFLSGTISSPTTKTAIRRFLLPNDQHVVYDAFSCSAIREAHQRTHNLRALPAIHLDRAKVIVSFDADFLGTWISPVQFAANYQAGRYLQGPVPALSYHVQFESRMSLTGSRADQRLCIAPGEMGLVMSHLAGKVAQKAGINWGGGNLEATSVQGSFLDQLAKRLWNDKGHCLVLCGSQDIDHQLLANFLNHLLNAYGVTLDLANPSFQNQSSDRDLVELLEELRQDQVGALFVYRSNPVFDLPGGTALRDNLRRVPLLVSFAPRLDETAALAKYVCPEPHYLESWNDAEAVAGVISLFQPVLQPRGEPRSLLETLASWKGTPRPGYEQLREYWQAHIYPRSLITVSFQEFWDHALQDGSVRVRSQPAPVGPFNQAAVSPIRQVRPAPADSFTVVLYGKVGMRNGSHAYNPWLQELPDPISKITWDNYACLSPAAAARLQVSQGDVVRLADDLELPVLIQPGQHDQVLAVALGYGSRLSERFVNIGPPWLEARPTLGANGLVGVNAAPLLYWQESVLRYQREGFRLTKTSGRHPLACTQDQPSLRVPLRLASGREASQPIIRETTLPAFLQTIGRARPPAAVEADLWPDDHPIEGSRWGMAIDLNACTGCSACVIACQVENNIPVVGKDEVRRHREMHWLRIDRYYSPSPVRRREGDVDVAHQPMLCQHCGNAPCEVVCPVLATVHSDEGLNQQVYNRCVGTRYCANNCPYKVRRFNWFDYAHDDHLQNLVLTGESWRNARFACSGFRKPRSKRAGWDALGPTAISRPLASNRVPLGPSSSAT